MTDFLLTNFRHKAVLDKRAKELIEQRDGYELIVKVPYSGPATLGVILAMTGDVGRFSNYRKYVAYTGYFAGLQKSQTNRPDQDVAPGQPEHETSAIPHCRSFGLVRQKGQSLQRTVPTQDGRGPGMVQGHAVRLCSAGQAHLSFLKFNDPYDVEKTFRGSSLVPASEEEWLNLGASLDEKFEVMETSLCQIEG